MIYLSCTINHLLFLMYYPLYVIDSLSYVIYHLLSIIDYLSSIIYHLLSIMYHLSSLIYYIYNIYIHSIFFITLYYSYVYFAHLHIHVPGGNVTGIYEVLGQVESSGRSLIFEPIPDSWKEQPKNFVMVPWRGWC